MAMRDLTVWSYDNMLHYGLSISNWEKMYVNLCGSVCSNALNVLGFYE